MLQFLSANDDTVIYINPRKVVAVTLVQGGCRIHTTSGESWSVEGSASEAQLRIWKAIA